MLESTLELLEQVLRLGLELILECLLKLIERLEPLLMESGAWSKLTKGVPRELSTLRVSVLDTSAITSARIPVSTSGMPIAMSIAVSIATSIAIIIIVTVSLAPFVIVPRVVSASRVPTLAAVAALILF